MKTPSEISNELGLAPSTVSEHIEELERMGAINKVDNPHVKKWKYYRANPEFNLETMMAQRTSRVPQFAAALIIIVGLIALLTLGIPALSSGSALGNNQVVFQLTDPPHVPNGTQALYITYSTIEANVTSASGASAWVSGSGSGTLNLMSLINASQVIGTGQIAANATINAVRFEISSAQIVINGTTYNVTVPSGQLTTQVSSGGKVSRNSSVLIDLSPVVTTVFTDNSTIFVLVSSVKAVIVGNTTAGLRVGQTHDLNGEENSKLSQATSKVGVASASMSVSGNTTTLSVTVENSGNQSVMINHVFLYGIPSVFVTPESDNDSMGVNIEAMPVPFGPTPFGVQPNATVGLNVNASITASENSSPMIETINGVHVRPNAVPGASAGGHLPVLSVNDSARLNTLVRVGAMARRLSIFDFAVAANGTLTLPYLSYPSGVATPDVICASCTPSVYYATPGYVLQPGASATFTYSGEIVYANGHIRITPVLGSKYRVVVEGNTGVEAYTNVTTVSG